MPSNYARRFKKRRASTRTRASSRKSPFMKMVRRKRARAATRRGTRSNGKGAQRVKYNKIRYGKAITAAGNAARPSMRIRRGPITHADRMQTKISYFGLFLVEQNGDGSTPGYITKYSGNEFSNGNVLYLQSQAEPWMKNIQRSANWIDFSNVYAEYVVLGVRLSGILTNYNDAHSCCVYFKAWDFQMTGAEKLSTIEGTANPWDLRYESGSRSIFLPTCGARIASTTHQMQNQPAQVKFDFYFPITEAYPQFDKGDASYWISSTDATSPTAHPFWINTQVMYSDTASNATGIPTSNAFRVEGPIEITFYVEGFNRAVNQ